VIISDVAIRHAATVIVLVIIVVVFGTTSYLTLPREAAPDVTIPYIIVSTDYPGVAPEDIESSITVPIEKKLKGIADVKEIRSSSVQGTSLVSVEFYAGVDLDRALQKVRDKVELAKSELPGDAEEPSISEVNLSEVLPVLILNVSGEVGLPRLKAVAEELQDLIEPIPGVLAAPITGGLEREIRIEFDPDRLAAYGIPISSLLDLIARENVNISGGTVDSSEAKFQLRVPQEFKDPGEINSLMLLVRNGKPIYLTDLARIIDTFKDPNSYARLDGRESVSIAVQKRSGENAVIIAGKVKEIVKRASKALPKGVKVMVVMDQSKWIGRLVHDLENNILSGVVLIVGVLFIFLGFRNSLFVALAVPASILITFIILDTFGITLNMVVLFSLILCLGMLVDNAIVLVENTYRHMQEGKGRLQAALEGAREIAWPITTATLTTVAAFFPLLFWPELMGEFFSYLPKTVIVALLASLFVALVINPTLCSLAMSVKSSRVAAATERRRHPILRAYARLLEAALDHRLLTLLAAFGFVILVIFLHIRFGRGIEFFPATDPDRASIDLRTAVGTRLEVTDAISRRIEKRLRKYSDIEHIVASVGSQAGGRLFGSTASGSHLGRIQIEFREPELRKEHSKVVVGKIRSEIQDIIGAEVDVEEEKMGPPVGAPIAIEVSGSDFEVLAELTTEVKRRMRYVPGVVDVRDDYEETRPEMCLTVERNRAALLGLNTSLIANFVKTAVQGAKVGTYREGNDEYDIVLRLPEHLRSDIRDVLRLYVPGLSGRQVPLSSLVRLRYASGPGLINRVNQKRVITVEANVEGRPSPAALEDVRSELATLPLPAGYSIKYRGEKEEQDKATRFLLKSLSIGIFLIFLILITQFNSLRVPLIILTGVVLSLGGVFLGLLVTQKPFGVIMTGLGVISLAGVIVNNGIVFLDFVRKLRVRGLAVREALVEAGLIRLRPVALTAITTIIGVTPMALGLSFNFRALSWETSSRSSQWWGPMAVAIIFGLAIGTVLTLIVLPVLYYSVHSGRGKSEG